MADRTLSQEREKLDALSVEQFADKAKHMSSAFDRCDLAGQPTFAHDLAAWLFGLKIPVDVESLGDDDFRMDVTTALAQYQCGLRLHAETQAHADWIDVCNKAFAAAQTVAPSVSVAIDAALHDVDVADPRKKLRRAMLPLQSTMLRTIQAHLCASEANSVLLRHFLNSEGLLANHGIEHISFLQARDNANCESLCSEHNSIPILNSQSVRELHLVWMGGRESFLVLLRVLSYLRVLRPLLHNVMLQ